MFNALAYVSDDSEAEEDEVAKHAIVTVDTAASAKKRSGGVDLSESDPKKKRVIDYETLCAHGYQNREIVELGSSELNEEAATLARESEQKFKAQQCKEKAEEDREEEFQQQLVEAKQLLADERKQVPASGKKQRTCEERRMQNLASFLRPPREGGWTEWPPWSTGQKSSALISTFNPTGSFTISPFAKFPLL